MIETHALAGARAAAEAKYAGEAEDALHLSAERDCGMKLAMRRVGRPREVGELITFLLAERAGYLTGATINIDGGTDF
jgi:NAD(P)-dependent dehydrogenase (short-subunit alcohol dehydrogenase family)